MTDNQDDAASLKPLYAARLAEDLERNSQEQERLSSEVAALQGKLETLRHDQALLVNMRQALGDTESAGEAAPAASGASASPAGTTPHASKPKVGRPKKSAAAQKGSSAKVGKGGSNGPTLRDLVVSHLSRAGEPCSALEVTDALANAHQDRDIKITVVRSTLEAMVAKGQVRRNKQGKSVFYTAVASA